MPSGLQGFLAVLLVLAIFVGCFAAVYLYFNDCQLIYQRAEHTMAEGVIEMRYYEDGYSRFTWPESKNIDGYFLRFLMTEKNGETRVIYTDEVENNEYLLPNLPLHADLHIEIYTYRNYQYPYQNFYRRRFSENCLRLSGKFGMPRISGLTWSADADTDQVQVRFEMDADTVARMYYLETDGSLTHLETLDRGKLTLSFGGEGPFSIPAFGENRTFVFDATVQTPDFVYSGLVCDQFTVVREDFLGTNLYLDCKDEGHNAFTLTWNETKGDHYEVQLYDDAQDRWITVHSVPRDGERRYYTGHLDRYSTFRYRVVALGGQTMPGTIFAARPAEVEVSTGASLLYSTIWNIMDLDVYRDTDKVQAVGRLPEGTACCILDEKDGMFKIRYRDGFGYIDSRYCMINLPEFIGDICLYNITNSYDSLYKVHEFGIPEVTGEVTKGYKHVELTEGEYLVPLLYPTALKLEKAAFAAMEEGCMIKIYDSYRPREATLDIYDLAWEIIEEKIPDEIHIDEEDRLELIWWDLEDTLLWYNVLQEDLEIPQELIDAFEAEPPEGTVPEETQPEGEDTPEEQPEDPNAEPEKKTLEDYRPTYKELMTDNDRYYLSNFLAYSGSRHNQGVAMDMTLVDMYTGEELEMQTSIHDLSWYSEQKQNNDAAKYLRRLMEGHGFTSLTSEWWHFQDDESRIALDLPYMYYGISPACWMADDYGWRYRTETGDYYIDCTQEIDGITYDFDSWGYAKEAAGNTAPAN